MFYCNLCGSKFTHLSPVCGDNCDSLMCPYCGGDLDEMTAIKGSYHMDCLNWGETCNSSNTLGCPVNCPYYSI